MHIRYLTLLFLLLCAKTAAIVFVILHAGIGLGPDEAQYWTWSQQLDWGYYSKPPGIAWQNGIGTYLFGNTELGVRSMPLLIGFIIPFLIYAMAKACRLTPMACFWAGVAMAFSPIGVMASFLSITDGGLILFWSAACAYFAGKIERKEMPSYEILGLFILCGALFKWPMYMLWIFIISSWLLYPRLVSYRLLSGIAISLLALIPSVYWNASHEWVTFRHVWATLSGGSGSKSTPAAASANFFEYFGAQSLLVSPILFILLLLGIWRLLRDKWAGKGTSGLMFCGFVSLMVLCATSIAALLMKMQGNWGIFAYPTAFVVIAWYAFNASERAKKWLFAGVVLSALLCGLTLAVPWLQSQKGIVALSYKLSPFRHNVGWDALQRELKAVGYDPERDFMFGDKYQTASILSFYSEGQKRAYFFNISGIRKNQFSFWPGMDQEERGKRGFFVVVENAPKLFTDASEIRERYERLLQPYFEHVSFLGMKPLFYANGQVVKGVFLFECVGFRGNIPEDPDLY